MATLLPCKSTYAILARQIILKINRRRGIDPAGNYPMPYTHIKKKIPRTLDRRVKITDETKKKIKELYNQGIAQREIARRTNASRRSIHFILFPKRLATAKKLYKERRMDGRYYIKEAHTKAMRKHRHYKQSIKDKLV